MCPSNPFLRSVNARMTVHVVSHFIVTFLTINRVVFKTTVLKTGITHAATNDNFRWYQRVRWYFGYIGLPDLNQCTCITENSFNSIISFIEDCLIGRGVVWSGRSLPAFRRNLMPPS